MKFAGHLVMEVLIKGCWKNLISEEYFFLDAYWKLQKNQQPCLVRILRILLQNFAQHVFLFVHPIFGELEIDILQHHCRRCGKCFCNSCCSEKVPLPRMCFVDPVLHCTGCVPVTMKENDFFDSQIKILIYGKLNLLQLGYFWWISQLLVHVHINTENL